MVACWHVSAGNEKGGLPYVAQAMEQSAWHLQQRSLPEGRWEQLVHGLCLPWHLARALLGAPAARRLYLRVAVTQALVVLGLGLALVWQQYQARKDAAASRAAMVEEVRRELGGSELTAEVPVEPLEEEPSEPEGLWFLWLKLLAALQGAQWVVVALSRDYHDLISREASLLTRLEPEDEPLEPRVRLNVRWGVRRVKQYLQGLWLTALGTPVLWLGSRVLPDPLDEWAFAVLSVAWSGWWVMVFTAGKSARAWREEATAEPWCLRGWWWLGEQAPVLKRFPLGLYGAVWEMSVRPVGSPAASAERQPWAFAGLAVVRVLSELPLLKCFIRPFIPVAAAHLLEVGGAAAGRSEPGPGEAELARG